MPPDRLQGYSAWTHRDAQWALTAAKGGTAEGSQLLHQWQLP